MQHRWSPPSFVFHEYLNLKPLLLVLLLLFILPFLGCAPLAEVEASVISGEAPLTVSFSNTSKNASEFQWDFGDGAAMTTGTIEEPVTHEYTRAGVHTVTLTAGKKGDPSKASTMTLTITVKHGSLDRVKLSPKAVEVTAGQSQRFTAEAADAYDNPIPEAHLSWEVAEGAGTIAADGMFTAATKAGTFPHGIVATATLNSDSAEATTSVIVKHEPLDFVKLSLFPDLNLENAIRGALGKGASDEITAAELAELTVLGAEGQDIADLTGIENCVNLVRLNLFGNQISDVSPLANLTSLTSLNLSDEVAGRANNQISDVSPLANLTSLISLHLSGNQISDFSPLANLTSLTSLGLHANQISDVSPLANLINLTDLYLRENQISDISPLANLTSLTSLGLHANQISDVSPLANLTNLWGLYLSENQISDVSPLANLINLTYLYLSENQISDVSPLANLTNLKALLLSDNQISDVSPLANLINLTQLYLSENQISDISPLVENSGLGAGDEVWLENNNLNLSEGSEDLENIRQLEERGVDVHY